MLLTAIMTICLDADGAVHLPDTLEEAQQESDEEIKKSEEVFALT